MLSWLFCDLRQYFGVFMLNWGYLGCLFEKKGSLSSYVLFAAEEPGYPWLAPGGWPKDGGCGAWVKFLAHRHSC